MATSIWSRLTPSGLAWRAILPSVSPFLTSYDPAGFCAASGLAAGLAAAMGAAGLGAGAVAAGAIGVVGRASHRKIEFLFWVRTIGRLYCKGWPRLEGDERRFSKAPKSRRFTRGLIS